jgi:hypothetical protein
MPAPAALFTCNYVLLETGNAAQSHLLAVRVRTWKEANGKAFRHAFGRS